MTRNFISHVFFATTLLIISWGDSATAQTISFDRYHSLAEIEAYVTDVCDAHADICDLVDIGTSQRGRRLIMLEVSSGDSSTKPIIYLNGTHHGNEKSSTESLLAITDYVFTNRDNDTVARLLDDYTILLQPVINPDGHVANTRGDARGRDPNRDYSYPEREDDASFRIPEILAIKDYLEGRNVFAAAAFHSGMEGVLFPWCYTGDSTTDHAAMREISRRYANAMDVSLVTQSYHDYPTRGEFIDYLYMRWGAFALTIEVSNSPTPPARRLAYYVEKTLQGTVVFLESLLEYEAGRLDTRPRFDNNQIALN